MDKEKDNWYFAPDPICVGQIKLDKNAIRPMIPEKFKDIKTHNKYDESWDKIVYSFIENGHGSTAKAQSIITGNGYVAACRVMQVLIDYKYMCPAEFQYDVMITKKQFDEIIAKRH